MSATIFVDTNVLLYARDASEPVKQPLARHWLDELWSRRIGRSSFQVMHEYYVAVTRKLKPGLTHAEAQADIRDLLTWRPLVADQEIVEDAWWLEARFELSYWDALVVAAARAARCERLLTEDLRDGQDLDGLIVTNPFTATPEECGLE